MPIVKDIDTQIPDAMRAKDGARLSALRNLKAAFITEAIALKRTSALSDDAALAVIRRLVKQRKDSAQQFRKGKREELAVAEEVESKILEAFLPAQMSEAEIKKIAEGVKTKLGISDRSKLGQLIGSVMKEMKGRADGAVVKLVVEQLFT
ncbi:MAG TPA: glutamyl-tRNA amidotransferase [Candidatus Taylorbacteria bacterium]|nr:MAG: GatB/Yqey domain-containing protein [Parcubacteria group bacterium GW2011_GWA2_47_64]KKU95443.1 MAG: GatB/Yqey domain-containing protein [Parcubacteria group bacterium GW2011_GWC2_48_17]HBV00842.1 glutamyl-tRNA amidotransferase [Candidatus Taylorbacteria bacterium]